MAKFFKQREGTIFFDVYDNPEANNCLILRVELLDGQYIDKRVVEFAMMLMYNETTDSYTNKPVNASKLYLYEMMGRVETQGPKHFFLKATTKPVKLSKRFSRVVLFGRRNQIPGKGRGK